MGQSEDLNRVRRALGLPVSPICFRRMVDGLLPVANNSGVQAMTVETVIASG